MNRRFAIALAACMLATASAAHAQGKDMLMEVVSFGGEAHGADSTCNLYRKHELTEMRNAQRKMAIERGLSAAEFDVAWADGYDRARLKMLAKSPADREATCAKLGAIAGRRPGGGG